MFGARARGATCSSASASLPCSRVAAAASSGAVSYTLSPTFKQPRQMLSPSPESAAVTKQETGVKRDRPNDDVGLDGCGDDLVTNDEGGGDTTA